MPKVSQAHLDARRRQILEAAVTCFAQNGLHRTTMQDIVRAARLSPGAIYRYFGGKDEIISALAEERHLREKELIAFAGDSPDIAASMRRLEEGFFGSLNDASELTQRRLSIRLWAEALSNPEILESVRKGVDEPRAMFADLVSKAQARGELSPNLPPDGLARVMIALFQGFILQKAWDEKADLSAYVAAVDELFESLVRPIRRKTKRRPEGF